jgi:NADPH:quinone reductase-like Zn-dependent oxidoreductase
MKEHPLLYIVPLFHFLPPSGSLAKKSLNGGAVYKGSLFFEVRNVMFHYFTKMEFIVIAFQLNSFDGDKGLTINNNVLKPVPSRDQVLVEVYAASINPIDRSISQGYLKEMLHLPVTLGGDFSGVVIEVGEAVSNFKKGDKVYGQAIVLNGGTGSFAQFVVANADNTAIQPNQIYFVDAASLPLAGASALQALEGHIQIKPDQKILIHGGAGGIGSLAVQIAKSHGAFVAATASANDLNYVLSLGADKVIDFRSEKFEDILKNYDAVFDTFSGDTTNRSLRVLKKGGIIVSMLTPADPVLAEKYQVTAIGQMTNTNTKKLNHLTDLVNDGKVKPQVDKIFSLNETGKAFKYLTEGHPKGKVVIKIKTDVNRIN